jgi:hypothetical protein
MQVYINETDNQFCSHRDEIVDQEDPTLQHEDFVNARPYDRATSTSRTRGATARIAAVRGRTGGMQQKARPTGVEDPTRDGR